MAVVQVKDSILRGPGLVLALTPKDRDNCNPFNGEMEVTAVNGDPAEVPNYTYTWYHVTDPGIDSTVITGVTGPQIVGKDKGFFTVMAVNNLTTCITASYSDSIRNGAVEPTLTIDTEQPMTNCIDPDGKFTIYAADKDSVDITDAYNFTWYVGYDTLPGNFLQNGKTVEDARAAVYTIVATDTITSCNTVESFELKALGNILPVFTTQKSCSLIKL